jgi:hypothetical protein
MPVYSGIVRHARPQSDFNLPNFETQTPAPKLTPHHGETWNPFQKVLDAAENPLNGICQHTQPRLQQPVPTTISDRNKMPFNLQAAGSDRLSALSTANQMAFPAMSQFAAGFATATAMSQVFRPFGFAANTQHNCAQQQQQQPPALIPTNTIFPSTGQGTHNFH